MPLHTWWTFTIATFFICATPGPNMLHMMASGMRHGFRQTVYTMAGCMLAVFSITSVSAAGLGTLLKASPHLFDLLRYLGAAYLIYVGVRTACNSGAAPLDAEATEEIPPSASPRGHFMSGLRVGLSNPKLLLFATAFFPQFIALGAPQLPQFALLLFTFFWIELGWYMTYAAGGSRIAKHLRNEKFQAHFNCLVGGLFAGFGLMLLRYRPA